MSCWKKKVSCWKKRCLTFISHGEIICHVPKLKVFLEMRYIKYRKRENFQDTTKKGFLLRWNLAFEKFVVHFKNLSTFHNEYMNYETEVILQFPFNKMYPPNGQIWDMLSIKRTITVRDLRYQTNKNPWVHSDKKEKRKRRKETSCL